MQTPQVRNERGAVIVMVAVSMAVILAMGALAVDMGMLIKQRDDAQKAADAAALAGAQEFLNGKPFDVKDQARDFAFEFLAKNYIGKTTIDTSGKADASVGTRYITTYTEGAVVVLPDSEKVRVIVRRAAVGTLFGKVLGFFNVPIAAKAAAQAVAAGTGKCVKPFAFPDTWDDVDNDNNIANRLEDLGKGQGPNTGEAWEYKKNGAQDRYRRFGDTQGSGEVTGLGSGFRNGSIAKGDKTNTRYYDDKGRPIVLKKSNPQQTATPGFFLPWVIPGSNPGANDYKANIVGCNPAQINLETEYQQDGSADTSSYDNKPGNMIGPTKQGMDDLIALDPDACWAEFPDPQHTGFTTGEVRKLNGAKNCTDPYPGWLNSPRVAIVPLFSPELFVGMNGRSPLKFNNLALIFVEDQQGRHDPVVGRFIYFVRGTGPADPNTGSLVKQLKLVE